MKQVKTRIFFVNLIEAYQKYASHSMPKSCRFIPSCSEYTKQALLKYGCIKGWFLGFKRLLRCHPFSGQHGYDPVK
ncbi:MAG: membrane protein insertion efficiency factor YidD [Candidatus Omnitrophota bacterium]|nr:MAG: membrane protein insertion efficiency factor YidD [Candidatus Omnitrophota bacterium]